MNKQDYVFVYTRQQAIDDGVFIDVSETAKEAGIRYPVAITSNLYNTWIKPTKRQIARGQSEQGRLWDVFTMFRFAAKNAKDSFMEFSVRFGRKRVKIWAVVEAQSPDDPSPAINVMLPEDR